MFMKNRRRDFSRYTHVKESTCFVIFLFGDGKGCVAWFGTIAEFKKREKHPWSLNFSKVY